MDEASFSRKKKVGSDIKYKHIQQLEKALSIALIEKQEHATSNMIRQNTSKTINDLKQSIFEFYQGIEEQAKANNYIDGIGTGFYDLDMFLNGLHKGEITVIASRPAMGKTSFAINIMLNVVSISDIPVLFISYEMNRYNILLRILSSFTAIDNMRIKSGCLRAKDWELLAKSLEKLLEFSDNGLINIISACKYKTEELYEQIDLFKQNNPDGVVFIDAFQLIPLNGNSDRITELFELATSLRRFVNEIDIPLVILSEVSKKCEERSDKRPLLSDLAECDALAQYADNIIFLYRDEYYFNEDSNNQGKTDVIIAKHKNGPVGITNLLFDASKTKFKNPIKADKF